MLGSSLPAEELPRISAEGSITVVLAENMSLLRGALTRLLGAEDDIEVPAAVECDAGLVDAVHLLRPDVVVVDVDNLVDRCMGAIAELLASAPDCRVVALAAATPAIVRRLSTMAVLSVIDRSAPADRLLAAIRSAAKGHGFVDTSLAAVALAMKPNPLTSQETQVLRLAADGGTGPEIAQQMCLSRGTVRNYLSKAIVKTGARGRTDAVRIASEAGWL
jgi:two-component system, NarL family, response regulator DesR